MKFLFATLVLISCPINYVLGESIRFDLSKIEGFGTSDGRYVPSNEIQEVGLFQNDGKSLLLPVSDLKAKFESFYLTDGKVLSVRQVLMKEKSGGDSGGG